MQTFNQINSPQYLQQKRMPLLSLAQG